MSSIVTPTFRAAFVAVFQPKVNNMSGNSEYSLVALFEKGEDLTLLKTAAKKAVVEKWGDKVPKVLRSPFRDQGDWTKYEGYEDGAIFVRLKSQQKPQVVDENVQEILDPSAVYSGCWCKASVNAYAYDNKGNRGVAFGLVNLQKVKDGEPLTSRSKATDDFAPVEGAESMASTPAEAAKVASATDLFS